MRDCISSLIDLLAYAEPRTFDPTEDIFFTNEATSLPIFFPSPTALMACSTNWLVTFDAESKDCFFIFSVVLKHTARFCCILNEWNKKPAQVLKRLS